MKKFLFLSVFLLTCVFVFVECFNKTQKPIEVPKNPQLITHKEAVDTLRADSNATAKPLILRKIKGKESYEWFKKNDISKLFIKEYPNNGFFGPDNYRIEFLITDVKKDSFNVNVYHVKGKNRHKKIITPFEGTIRMLDIGLLTDPNLDSMTYENMAIEDLLVASGEFEFREDPASKFSGVFKGTIKTEFSKHKSNNTYHNEPFSLWYYSEGLPSEGSGYRFDGNWTSYTNPTDVKNVVWADDLFRFANNIIKDFSYGEREVVINEAYRNLGWQEMYSEEEWWNPPTKPNM